MLIFYFSKFLYYLLIFILIYDFTQSANSMPNKLTTSAFGHLNESTLISVTLSGTKSYTESIGTSSKTSVNFMYNTTYKNTTISDDQFTKVASGSSPSSTDKLILSNETAVSDIFSTSSMASTSSINSTSSLVSTTILNSTNVTKNDVTTTQSNELDKTLPSYTTESFATTDNQTANQLTTQTTSSQSTTVQSPNPLTTVNSSQMDSPTTNRYYEKTTVDLITTNSNTKQAPKISTSLSPNDSNKRNMTYETTSSTSQLTTNETITTQLNENKTTSSDLSNSSSNELKNRTINDLLSNSTKSTTDILSLNNDTSTQSHFDTSTVTMPYTELLNKTDTTSLPRTLPTTISTTTPSTTNLSTDQSTILTTPLSSTQFNTITSPFVDTTTLTSVSEFSTLHITTQITERNQKTNTSPISTYRSESSTNSITTSLKNTSPLSTDVYQTSSMKTNPTESDTTSPKTLSSAETTPAIVTESSEATTKFKNIETTPFDNTNLTTTFSTISTTTLSTTTTTIPTTTSVTTLTSTPITTPLPNLNNKTTSIPNISGRSLFDLLFLLGNLTLNELRNRLDLNQQLDALNLTELEFEQDVSRTILISKDHFTVPCRNYILSNYTMINFIASLKTFEMDKFNQVRAKNLSTTNFNYAYHPSIGFVVESSNTDSMEKTFEYFNVKHVECELNYSVYKDVKTMRQKFTLIYLNPKIIRPMSIPNFYKLYSSNRTSVSVKLNDSIKLECYAITYKKASSRYGFVWKWRSLNKAAFSKRYQDEQKTLSSSELINEMLSEELDLKVIRSQLTITNVDLSNTGYHYCEYDSDLVRKSIGLFVEVKNVTIDRNTNGEIDVQERSFVKFESEHSPEYPLKIKSKETFLLRFKIIFNETSNVTLICLRRMQTILSRTTKYNTASGSTISFSHKIESADVRDSGDYTLLVIKHKDESDTYEDATISNLFQKLKQTQYNMRSVIVNVEDNQECMFESEKFYPNNDYTAVCHIYSNLPTILIWKWSNCVTELECLNPNNWRSVESNQLNGDESGNSESFFKIIAINNEQINILDFRYQKDVSYACISENELGTTNVTFRLQPSDTDLSIRSSENNLFTNDNLTMFCNGIFHQEPAIIWLFQKDDLSPQLILTDKNIKNYSK